MKTIMLLSLSIILTINIILIINHEKTNALEKELKTQIFRASWYKGYVAAQKDNILLFNNLPIKKQYYYKKDSVEICNIFK